MSNDEEQYNTLSRLPRFRRDKRKTKKKVSNSITKGERKALSSPYGYNLRKTIRKSIQSGGVLQKKKQCNKKKTTYGAFSIECFKYNRTKYESNSRPQTRINKIK